jgi:threonine/homoserine/homoserine lactone efflux protein
VTLTQAVLGFAVVAGLMALTPGLDTALVLRTAVQRGRGAAFVAALGITTGVLVWAVAAAVGVSALVAASATAGAALRTVGAAYMVWLGVRMVWRAVRRTGHAAAPEATPHRAGGRIAAFRQGALVNLLNPKVGAFYVAVLPQFLPAGYAPAPVALLLATIHNLEALAWFAVLILGIDRFGRWFRRPSVERGVDAGAGAVIVGFGVTLALSR